MKKSRIATLIVFFVLIPLTLIVGSRLSGRAFYVTSTLVIVELLIPFFLAFEGRRPQARELVVLAVMCALAVGGRVAIPIPSFKAIFGIIMIAGIAFGPESGFLVGAISALASNFFYSQGPYTPWQMMAYGAGGMLAGFVFAEGRLPRKPVVMGIFGFLAVTFFCRVAAGYLFGVSGDVQNLPQGGDGVLYFRVPGEPETGCRHGNRTSGSGEAPAGKA